MIIFKTMKSIFLILLFLSVKVVQAHQPDLSNLMIYEQNGKCFIVIKSSLTAFEGEINHVFGKNAYKSPEEFEQLVIKHFKKNCLVIVNDDTIKLHNPKVMLGHETTLFVELLEAPKTFKSVYIRNTLFQDMPSNMCEIILTLNGIQPKQYIIDNANKHEVKLVVDNVNWVVVKPKNSTFVNQDLLLMLMFLLMISVIIIIAVKEKKKINK